MSGVAAAAAPKRDLHPQTPRPATPGLDAGAEDEFRASAIGPRPNRYDEVIDRLRLAALRRDAAAAAASSIPKSNIPTDDDAVQREGPDRSGP